jgi:hypothetical protein
MDVNDSVGESMEFSLQHDKIFPVEGEPEGSVFSVGWEGRFDIDYAYAVEMGIVDATAIAPDEAETAPDLIKACDNCDWQGVHEEDGVPCEECEGFSINDPTHWTPVGTRSRAV